LGVVDAHEQLRSASVAGRDVGDERIEAAVDVLRLAQFSLAARPHTITVLPSLTNRLASARPIPDAPPVMRTVWFEVRIEEW